MEIKKITKHENKSKVASIVGDAATESNQKSIDQIWAKLEAVFSTESKALSFLNKVWDKVNYKEFMDLVDHGFLDRIDDNNAKTMAAKIAESKNQSQAINVYYAEMKGLPAQHASGTNFNAQDTQESACAYSPTGRSARAGGSHATTSCRCRARSSNGISRTAPTSGSSPR